MPAITFSVQVASDGFNVARAVAVALGYRYFDWQIVSAALKRLPAEEEEAHHLAERMMNRLSVAALLEGEVPAGFLSPPPSIFKHTVNTLFSQEYRAAVEDVIRYLASEGEAVIVGHAGQIVLRERPDVFKVLIRGSSSRRAVRLAEEQQVDMEDAIFAVGELDDWRTQFFQDIYDTDCLDASNYDLTINTDTVEPVVASELIIRATQGSYRARRREVPLPAMLRRISFLRPVEPVLPVTAGPVD